MGSTRPVGEDRKLWCGQTSATAQRETRVDPGRRAHLEDVNHMSEEDVNHSSPGLQLELGDMQVTRGLPTSEMEGTCS